MFGLIPDPCHPVNGIIHLRIKRNLSSISQQIISVKQWIKRAAGSIHSMPSVPFCLIPHSYKNVICLGHILDAEGQKMSKTRGNVVSPWEVLEKHGADALRWYLYTASPPGQERRFSSDLVGEVVRNFTLTLVEYLFLLCYLCQPGWMAA